MSFYILDTDTLTLLQMNHPVVKQRAGSHSPRALAITVISVEEQLTGWYTRLRRARKPDEVARAYQLLADRVRYLGGMPVLAFPESAIRRYEQLKALKLNIGKNDLRIAAITLEFGGILVTRNLRDFQRVPGLTIENWAA